MSDRMRDHESLGDGVYACYDGYQIWLTVGAHTNEPMIALEPAVLEALVRYADRLEGSFGRPYTEETA